MGFFNDIFSIFKKSELELLESYKESADVYTFSFKKDKDLTWNAGQHGLFTITHKKIKDSIRPFSVASSSNEDVIKITTRIGENPSEFKKALLELKSGMKVSMSGPVGSFYLKDNSPTLLIAGGIGITPFRAMVKQLETEGNGKNNKITLLYLDSKKSFAFKEELDQIAKNTSIDISYLESRDELYKSIENFISTHKNNGKYYIAGSKSMVDSISGHLTNNHISKKNIKKHNFRGI
ncbi:FAD-dependent oxidoreductase [Sutcliffiella rhizosphaerae]|uniref:Dihydroorotate dehydrogenase B (NAD(+)), electron transfer subunit n=1 Tax=Sutcliffiella rhizosphaerae TaxID=2880967 RepID=A0ABM8YMS6_9BACI|nr:FAD-dependent oxidoreductase [Sutcliffiella rhizosphaerae]CAG9621295.1 Dihydroorotate dehydrogenase B (NAD(+)), electron transfer subunit [Sutcliffiella rhizosphaerae]